MNQNPRPEIVVDSPCETGEGPLWHPAEQRIYWVDIPKGILYRHSPSGQRTETFHVGAPIGGFTLQEDGALLLFMARGAVTLWRDGAKETVIESLPDELDNRFNDVTADPRGRVFCGTMSPPQRAGRLYRLDPDRSIRVVMEDIGTSNGIGFTPDRRGMYYTDTRPQEIYRFDYDAETGAISNRRLFARPAPGEGRPDGLTVDAEGCVWSARWDGYRVVRYDPDGREMLQVHFPARNVSSVAFGGDDYRDLYVTTAGGHDRARNGPHAGALFRLRPGVRGVPEFRSRIGCA